MSAPAVLIATAKLRSGKEEDFNAWQARHNAVAHRFPGFISSTSEHLEAWMNSPERAELLRESKVFVAQEQLLRLATSFPGWVPINPLTGKGPPNWKTALLVILGEIASLWHLLHW